MSTIITIKHYFGGNNILCMLVIFLNLENLRINLKLL